MISNCCWIAHVTYLYIAKASAIRFKPSRNIFSLKKLASDLTQAWCDMTVNWYGGEQKAVSDVIAFVWREIWASNYFNDSANSGDHVKINRDT